MDTLWVLPYNISNYRHVHAMDVVYKRRFSTEDRGCCAETATDCHETQRQSSSYAWRNIVAAARPRGNGMTRQ